jgi:hypothetical protein
MQLNQALVDVMYLNSTYVRTLLKGVDYLQSGGTGWKGDAGHRHQSSAVEGVDCMAAAGDEGVEEVEAGGYGLFFSWF